MQFAATKIDQVAIGQGNLQTLDIFSRRTILESARAGGVRRHITPEEATAFSWIWRIKQAFCVNRTLKVLQNHAGFGNCSATAVAAASDAHDAIQFVSSEHDATERHATRDGAGAGAGDGNGSSGRRSFS